MVKKVGIITAGGDCPGLNAVIRGAVKTAEYNNVEVYGFLEGYKGLLENRYIKLDSNNNLLFTILIRFVGYVNIS